MRGKFKGREGKVTAVYRKKFVIHVERISMDKSNGAFFARARAWPPAPRGAANPPPSPLPSGATVNVGIHPSNVKITKLTRMDRDRTALVARKAKGRKNTTAGADAMVA